MVHQKMLSLTLLNGPIIRNRPISFQESEVINTGLSNFHKMSLTIMMMFNNKQNPKVIQYRKHKDFFNEVFMHELESTLLSFSQISFGRFKSTGANALQKNALIIKRSVRTNQASVINSKKQKEGLRRTRLRNKFI